MSTPVDRYAPPRLFGPLSWYATPSPPLSKSSAWIVPGTGAGDPENGVDAPNAGAAAARQIGSARNRSFLMCPPARPRTRNAMRRHTTTVNRLNCATRINGPLEKLLRERGLRRAVVQTHCPIALPCTVDFFVQFAVEVQRARDRRSHATTELPARVGTFT